MIPAISSRSPANHARSRAPLSSRMRSDSARNTPSPTMSSRMRSLRSRMHAQRKHKGARQRTLIFHVIHATHGADQPVLGTAKWTTIDRGALCRPDEIAPYRLRYKAARCDRRRYQHDRASSARDLPTLRRSATRTDCKRGVPTDTGAARRRGRWRRAHVRRGCAPGRRRPMRARRLRAQPGCACGRSPAATLETFASSAGKASISGPAGLRSDRY